MRHYSELSEVEQTQLNRRYKLPKDKSEVHMNRYGQAVYKDSPGLSVYPVKSQNLIDKGFHNHYSQDKFPL